MHEIYFPRSQDDVCAQRDGGTNITKETMFAYAILSESPQAYS